MTRKRSDHSKMAWFTVWRRRRGVAWRGVCWLVDGPRRRCSIVGWIIVCRDVCDRFVLSNVDSEPLLIFRNLVFAPLLEEFTFRCLTVRAFQLVTTAAPTNASAAAAAAAAASSTSVVVAAFSSVQLIFIAPLFFSAAHVSAVHPPPIDRQKLCMCIRIVCAHACTSLFLVLGVSVGRSVRLALVGWLVDWLVGWFAGHVNCCPQRNGCVCVGLHL